MRQSLEPPSHSSLQQQASSDSPARQVRSMSVAVPAGLSPVMKAPKVCRPRTNSLPSPAFLLGFSDCRDPTTCVSVRSFTTTSKGVVNAGDIVRRTSINSLMSSGSTITDIRRRSCGQPSLPEGDHEDSPDRTDQRQRTLSVTSTDSSGSVCFPHTSSSLAHGGTTGPSYFRVVLLGDDDVGKTSLIRQFSSSEYMGTYDACSSDGDLSETTIVPVLLDNVESVMEFLDGADARQANDVNVDAYILVFSIVDRNSFVVARDLARQLRVNIGTDRVIIFVGNKSDLVRKRQVTVQEAKDVATTYDLKYIETSAALNHHVDQLVAGTLALTRRQLLPPALTLLSLPPTKSRSRTPSPVSFFNKLFKKTIKESLSCDGIFLE